MIKYDSIINKIIAVIDSISVLFKTRILCLVTFFAADVWDRKCENFVSPDRRETALHPLCITRI